MKQECAYGVKTRYPTLSFMLSDDPADPSNILIIFVSTLHM